LLKTLNKICDTISKGVNAVAITLFAVMVLACVVQVFARYILNDSPRWTEEMARYTFIWVHFLGATICVRTGSNATITLFRDMLKGYPRRILDAFITTVTAIVGGVMVYGGIEMAQRTHKQLTVGMKMPMSFVYASAAVFGVITVLYAVTMLLENLYGRGKYSAKAEQDGEGKYAPKEEGAAL
jgi:TRAP-type C4-dicarboxylate transport system permease small subunit